MAEDASRPAHPPEVPSETARAIVRVLGSPPVSGDPYRRTEQLGAALADAVR
ncbi:MAG TPA: hypothetical protein VGN93_09485 [Shinella sp.]|uniref:hypothetical protein n=1 Tax=Shinella sp. TaxID=1870904 RepID=UPI002E1648AD|nr:hypothetical protein [Shinella sp.]